MSAVGSGFSSVRSKFCHWAARSTSSPDCIRWLPALRIAASRSRQMIFSSAYTSFTAHEPAPVPAPTSKSVRGWISQHASAHASALDTAANVAGMRTAQ